MTWEQKTVDVIDNISGGECDVMDEEYRLSRKGTDGMQDTNKGAG